MVDTIASSSRLLPLRRQRRRSSRSSTPAFSTTRRRSTPSWRAFFDALLSRENAATLFSRGCAARRWTRRTALRPIDGVRGRRAAPTLATARRRRPAATPPTADEIRAAAQRHHARPHADPRLPRARPSRGRPRPARPRPAASQHPELDYRTYGFTDADWTAPIFIDNVLGLERRRLRQIMAVLRETYCGTIGVEFMHIQIPTRRPGSRSGSRARDEPTDFTGRGQARDPASS